MQHLYFLIKKTKIIIQLTTLFVHFTYKKYVPLLLALWLAVSGTEVTAQADTLVLDSLEIQEIFKEAVSDYEREDYNSALEKFNLVIKYQPTNAEAYGYRASEMYFTDMDFYDAFEDVDKAIQLGSKDPRWYALRGDILMELEETEQAIADYTFALEHSAPDSMVLFKRSMSYFFLEKNDSALADINAAIKLAPANAGMFYLRALIYQRTEQYAQAAVDYERYGKLEQGDGEFYINMAACKNEAYNYAGALADAAKGVALNGDPLAANYEMGRASLGLKDYAKAVDYFSFYIQKETTYADVYYLRGRAYMQLKEEEKALADWDKAIELLPAYAEPFLEKGKYYQHEKDFDKATRVFTQGLAFESDAKAEFYFLRGQCHAAKESYTKALEDYTMALSMRPNEIEWLTSRAEIYVRRAEKSADNKAYKDATANYEKALVDLQNAMRLSPYNTAIYDRMNAVKKDLKKLE
jgi:tetratricopeptide (TPR) repeat protein